MERIGRMLNEPLISIIVPVFNLEAYIARTLHSILSQTYKNIEIIVVDDGSSDRSAEIVSQLQNRDHRIKLIRENNSGVVLARRNGVNHAQGEYIGFVDGDDIIDDDMYAFLLQNILKENADISHCGYIMHVGERKDFYYNTCKYLVQNNQDGLYDLISGKFIEPGLCNKLYKKEIILEAINKSGLERFKNLEDLLINYFAFKYSQKSIYEDQCKYHYILRKNSASTSKVTEKKVFDPIHVIQIIKEDCPITKVKEAAYKRYVAMLIGASTLCNLNTVRKKVIKMLRQETKNVFSSSYLGLKIKIMFLLSAYFPSIYFIIRKIYEKITHIDKKYEV